MSYTMTPDEVSATIDAERSRQMHLQQNGGSEQEPLERVTLLQIFREGCAVWYGWRDSLCVRARRSVYTTLLDRYGPAAVVRWQSNIKDILDTAEAEVYATVRDGCPLCRRHAGGDPAVGRAHNGIHDVVYANGAFSCRRPCSA